MRRLIDDLLSLTRIEMNEHVPPHGRVALEGAVRQAVNALMPLAAQDNITVTVEAAPGLPPVTGEHDELVQLFQNLVHNAIKYGRENGQVKVILGLATDGQVFAAVKDDGRALPPTPSPSDRAILPGRCEAQPRKGWHGAGAWPSSSISSAATKAGCRSNPNLGRQRFHGVSACRGGRKPRQTALPEPVTEML